MIEQLIAEATECDFKVALEIKKPKSWLKSVIQAMPIFSARMRCTNPPHAAFTSTEYFVFGNFEVQWNGAQIGVVWKLGADVFFYFVEVFVGECVHNQILESFLLSKSCLFDSIVLLFTTMMQEIMVII